MDDACPDDSDTMRNPAAHMRWMVSMDGLICDVVHKSADSVVCIAALLQQFIEKWMEILRVCLVPISHLTYKSADFEQLQ